MTLAPAPGPAHAPGHGWRAPESLLVQTHTLAAFVLVLAGVCVWEFLTWLPFDARVLLRRRFRWPMVLYFVCRLSMLLHILFFAINLNTLVEIPCQSFVWVSKVTDLTGTVSSSAVLALRSHAVWGHDRRVGGVLLACLLVQAGLWTATFGYSRSKWDPTHRVCRVGTTAPNNLIIGVFAWTMVYDFFILALAVYALWPDRAFGGISTLLLRDGLGYFIAAFAANGVQAVLAALRLSPVMNIMCLPFALVVSTISAAIVFRHVLVTPDGWGRTARGVATGATLPRFARPKPGASTSGSASEGPWTAEHELTVLERRERVLPEVCEADEDAFGARAYKRTGEDVDIEAPDVIKT